MSIIKSSRLSINGIELIDKNITKRFGDPPFYMDAPETCCGPRCDWYPVIPIKYTSRRPNVATITQDRLITIVGAGRAVFSASVDTGSVACGRRTGNTITGGFDVLPISPNIDPWTISGKNFGEPSFNITGPNSNSTGAFSYTSSDDSVATITTGGEVTIVNAGTTTITATQAASGNYTSGSVTAQFAVSRALFDAKSAAQTEKNNTDREAITTILIAIDAIAIDSNSTAAINAKSAAESALSEADAANTKAQAATTIQVVNTEKEKITTEYNKVKLNTNVTINNSRRQALNALEAAKKALGTAKSEMITEQKKTNAAGIDIIDKAREALAIYNGDEKYSTQINQLKEYISNVETSIKTQYEWDVVQISDKDTVKQLLENRCPLSISETRNGVVFINPTNGATRDDYLFSACKELETCDTRIIDPISKSILDSKSHCGYWGMGDYSFDNTQKKWIKNGTTIKYNYTLSLSGIWAQDPENSSSCIGAPGSRADLTAWCIFSNENDAKNKCNSDPAYIGYVTNSPSGFQLTKMQPVVNTWANGKFYKKTTTDTIDSAKSRKNKAETQFNFLKPDSALRINVDAALQVAKDELRDKKIDLNEIKNRTLPKANNSIIDANKIINIYSYINQQEEVVNSEEESINSDKNYSETIILYANYVKQVIDFNIDNFKNLKDTNIKIGITSDLESNINQAKGKLTGFLERAETALKNKNEYIISKKNEMTPMINYSISAGKQIINIYSYINEEEEELVNSEEESINSEISEANKMLISTNYVKKALESITGEYKNIIIANKQKINIDNLFKIIDKAKNISERLLDRASQVILRAKEYIKQEADKIIEKASNTLSKVDETMNIFRDIPNAPTIPSQEAKISAENAKNNVVKILESLSKAKTLPFLNKQMKIIKKELGNVETAYSDSNSNLEAAKQILQEAKTYLIEQAEDIILKLENSIQNANSAIDIFEGVRTEAESIINSAKSIETNAIQYRADSENAKTMQEISITQDIITIADASANKAFSDSEKILKDARSRKENSEREIRDNIIKTGDAITSATSIIFKIPQIINQTKIFLRNALIIDESISQDITQDIETNLENATTNLNAARDIENLAETKNNLTKALDFKTKVDDSNRFANEANIKASQILKSVNEKLSREKKITINIANDAIKEADDAISAIYKFKVIYDDINIESEEEKANNASTDANTALIDAQSAKSISEINTSKTNALNAKKMAEEVIGEINTKFSAENAKQEINKDIPIIEKDNYKKYFEIMQEEADSKNEPKIEDDSINKNLNGEQILDRYIPITQEEPVNRYQPIMQEETMSDRLKREQTFDRNIPITQEEPVNRYQPIIQEEKISDRLKREQTFDRNIPITQEEPVNRYQPIIQEEKISDRLKREQTFDRNIPITQEEPVNRYQPIIQEEKISDKLKREQTFDRYIPITQEEPVNRYQTIMQEETMSDRQRREQTFDRYMPIMQEEPVNRYQTIMQEETMSDRQRREQTFDRYMPIMQEEPVNRYQTIMQEETMSDRQRREQTFDRYMPIMQEEQINRYRPIIQDDSINNRQRREQTFDRHIPIMQEEISRKYQPIMQEESTRLYGNTKRDQSFNKYMPIIQDRYITDGPNKGLLNNNFKTANPININVNYNNNNPYTLNDFDNSHNNSRDKYKTTDINKYRFDDGGIIKRSTNSGIDGITKYNPAYLANPLNKNLPKVTPNSQCKKKSKWTSID